jgi:hypothetical protein
VTAAGLAATVTMAGARNASTRASESPIPADGVATRANSEARRGRR